VDQRDRGHRIGSRVVELYNPSDIYPRSPRRPARRPAWRRATAADDLSRGGISPEETVAPADVDAYAAAANEWAASQPGDADDPETAAHRLYDLALTFQERSQLSEAHLLEQFQSTAGPLAGHLGDLIVIDDDDERLTLTGAGRIVAEVVPEGAEGAWRTLGTPEELVEFYDPTDVFGDVADAVAEAYPSVAPEMDDEDDAVEDAEDEQDEVDDEEDEEDEEDGAEDRGR